MSLDKHPRMLLVMIAEATLERWLVEDSHAPRGLRGYTVSDVRGGGHEWGS